MAISSLYGLIGFPLGHSFSKKYFTEKFQSLGLSKSHAYEQFPIASIDEFPDLLAQHKSTLKGLNVTIPYKQLVMPFLSEIDSAAKKIGAVNTIKILPNGHTIGYNSDYWGFKNTLTSWTALSYFKSKKALVLGQGGAAKAIIVALEDLGIPVIKVSRVASDDAISYEEIPSIISEIGLIVNTTPLGMFPNIDTSPPLPYAALNEQHFLYDAVYNPLETLFLKKGIAARVGGTHTGIDMLIGQADKAWEIWKS
jgi:shikimate dehydrogenase